MVLVNDIDEIVRVHDGFDQLSSRRVRRITLCPVIAETVSFVLEKSETIQKTTLPSKPKMTQFQRW